MENFLLKLFEHNNWANRQMIEVCTRLTEEQLDAQPQSATKGSIRQTLVHLVSSQRGYLALLTQPAEARNSVPPAFDELQESARLSGEGLLALLRGEMDSFLNTRLQTTDGYYVDSWVVIVQIINHATEHREQLSSMLSSLGVTPPDLDGWSYGEATRALIPISSK